MARRARIGLILGTKDSDYPRAIRLGVQNTLEDSGALLVNIADLIPYHTHSHTKEYLRVAFELAARLELDAVIVPMGTVNGYLEGDEALARTMLSALDPAKTIVIERSFPNTRCVYKDGKPGMHECMKHLIETCGFTRIAFISGPETSVGARERESVYFEEMAAHGLDVPPEYFVRGKFSGECDEVIIPLLDDHPELQAICCSADLIAFSVYRLMRARKLVVGRDFAVTGFDDHYNAVHMDPPLSTVHLTGYDFGCMAAREALRLCRGEAQEEFTLSGSFIARGSCGERVSDEIRRFRELLRIRPFPTEKVVEMLIESTISMAGASEMADFRSRAIEFVSKVRAAYLQHMAAPTPNDTLFTEQDLADLYICDYRRLLSLEGFHNICLNVLEALLGEAQGDEVEWLLDQISNMHLHVARMLHEINLQDTLDLCQYEWHTFHLAEDALIGNDLAQTAYEEMLGELAGLGIRQADLYLLPESAEVVGGNSFALSDSMQLVGSLCGDSIRVYDEPENVELQKVLDRAIPHYEDTAFCSVAGIMAGKELLGIMVIDPGYVNDNRQLMAMLNMGLALKHLQMLANERELNEVLRNNNLLLTRQSQRDEMTGLLNRRGLNDAIAHALLQHPEQLSALFYLDLDGLKYINDNLGHDMGDEAIKAAAEVLERSLPDSCLIGRMGGDEFVAFAQVEDEEEARCLGDMVQRGVDAYNEHNTAPFTLSISYGFSCFPSGESDPDELVMQAMMAADGYMYKMKQQHRQSRTSRETAV